MPAMTMFHFRDSLSESSEIFASKSASLKGRAFLFREHRMEVATGEALFGSEIRRVGTNAALTSQLSLFVMDNLF